MLTHINTGPTRPVTHPVWLSGERSYDAGTYGHVRLVNHVSIIMISAWGPTSTVVLNSYGNTSQA